MIKRTTVVFFALAVIVCVSPSKAQIVEDGLISYWSFDQASITGKVAKDMWGKNDATLNGDIQIVAGKLGDAVQLDGDGDYVDCGNDASLNVGVDDFSIEYCVKYGTPAAKAFAFIKMKPAADYTGFHSSICASGVCHHNQIGVFASFCEPLNKLLFILADSVYSNF